MRLAAMHDAWGTVLQKSAYSSKRYARAGLRWIGEALSKPLSLCARFFAGFHYPLQSPIGNTFYVPYEGNSTSLPTRNTPRWKWRRLFWTCESFWMMYLRLASTDFTLQWRQWHPSAQVAHLLLRSNPSLRRTVISYAFVFRLIQTFGIPLK